MSDRRQRKFFPAFIMGFPALVTFVALGFAVPLLFQAKSFVESSVRVTGQVVSIREQESCSTYTTDRQGRSLTSKQTRCTTLLYPVVKFTTLTGEPHEHEIMKFVNRFDEKPGDPVQLRYLRDNPWQVQLDDWQAIWGLPLGLLALGGVFGAAWFGMLRVNRRVGPLPEPRMPGAMRAHMKVPVWVTVVTLLVPGLLALLTGTIAAGAIEFWQNSRLTQAIVVSAAAGPEETPVFRYRDHRGQEIEGEPETPPFETFNVAGMPTQIRHRLDDPAVFRAAPTAFSIWKPGIVVGMFALLFGVVMVAALRFMARG